MKKKIIYPLSIVNFVWLSIWIIAIGFCIFGIIIIFKSYEYDFLDTLALVFAILGNLVSVVILIWSLNKKVAFESDKIKVPADPTDKNGLLVRRFQHKIEIKYEEIMNISLIASTKDSQGKTVEYVFLPMPYIVFECYDGKQKAINVYNYTKKQTIKIIDEAIKRAKYDGNNLEIESGEKILQNFLLSMKRKKK